MYDCMFENKKSFFEINGNDDFCYCVIRSRAADFIVLISIINTLWHKNSLCSSSWYRLLLLLQKHELLVIDLCRSSFIILVFFSLNIRYANSWNFVKIYESDERQCSSTICLCERKIISMSHRPCDVKGTSNYVLMQALKTLSHYIADQLITRCKIR